METTEGNSPRNQSTPPKPASRTIPGIIIRLFLVLAIGCLVGAVIYFAAAGWVPYLDQRILQPIDTNQARVLELLSTQEALEADVQSLRSTLDSQQSGIAPGIEATLEALSADLTTMGSQIDTNTYLAGTLAPAMVATISSRQDTNERYLSAIATAQMRDAGNRQQIALLRSLELMSWSHQYILHDNYGLAENELKFARDNLSSMVTRVPPLQRIVVLEMLNLVDEALADLPSRPGLAADKIRLAWHLGVNEFPTLLEEGQGATYSPTPYLTPSPTPN